MFKLGVNYTTSSGLNCADNFRLFSDIGFESVFSGFADIKTVEEIAENAHKNNIAYESIHAPFKNINDIWQEGQNGDIMLSQLCNTVEACKAFEVPITVVHLSSGEDAPCITDIGHRRFDTFVECAIKNNVTVAFENQRKLANIAFVFELYKDIQNVGFCLDTGHEACFTRGVKYMPLFGKRLVYTHISDNFSVYNEDLHLIPFDGNIDFEEFADYIVEYGYKGSLNLEISPRNNAMYENFSCSQYYEKAFKRIEKLKNMIIDKLNSR